MWKWDSSLYLCRATQIQNPLVALRDMECQVSQMQALCLPIHSVLWGTDATTRVIGSPDTLFSPYSSSSFWSYLSSKDESIGDKGMTPPTSWGTTLESSCKLTQGHFLKLCVPCGWAQQSARPGSSDDPIFFHCTNSLNNALRGHCHHQPQGCPDRRNSSRRPRQPWNGPSMKVIPSLL